MNELIRKLITAQAEYPSIPRSKTATVVTKTGGKYSYNYADLGDVVKAVLPVLHKHGIYLKQPLIVVEGKQYLQTMLTDGQETDISHVILPPIDDPQEFGAVITFLRRYSLCAQLGIVTEEDTDGPPKKGKDDKKPVEAEPKRIITDNQVSGPYRGMGSTLPPTGKISPAQLKRLFAIQKSVNKTDEEVKAIALGLGITCSRADLNKEQYDKLCNAIEGKA